MKTSTVNRIGTAALVAAVNIASFAPSALAAEHKQELPPAAEKTMAEFRTSLAEIFERAKVVCAKKDQIEKGPYLGTLEDLGERVKNFPLPINNGQAIPIGCAYSYDGKGNWSIRTSDSLITQQDDGNSSHVYEAGKRSFYRSGILSDNPNPVSSVHFNVINKVRGELKEIDAQKDKAE